MRRGVCAAILAIAACNERPLPSAPASARASDAEPSALETPAPAAPVATGSPAPPRDAGPPPPKCPATPWAAYAHDFTRTSASEGCAEGPLTVAWRFTRKSGCGYRARAGRVTSVVGDEGAIFAALDCGHAPAVMRITPAGEPMWTFSRADEGRTHWPALAEGSVVYADDGLYVIDRETGKFRMHDLDVWGEPIPLGDTILVDNGYQLDGYGPFLGAVDLQTLKWKYRVSSVNAGKDPKIARTGGIAYDGGVVVHAAAMGAHSVPSLAAHDAASGERKWIASGTWPESAPSIAGGRVFVVERWSGERTDRLVARALEDGAVAWSRPIAWSRGPAPVLAGKLVVLHGADGVQAFARDTGEPAWTNPTPRKALFVAPATTLAAAMGSHTLVVTSGPRLVVLRLEDGKEQWSGAVASGWSDTEPGGITIERPVIVGKSVYVTADGTLIRLDSK